MRLPIILLISLVCVVNSKNKKWYDSRENSGHWKSWEKYNQIPDSVITEVIYKITENGRYLGDIIMKLNKGNSPFTSEDFITVMKSLKEQLESQELDLTNIYPQLKHDWSVDNYERCPFDQYNNYKRRSRKLGKGRKHGHGGQEMDDMNAYRMFPWSEDKTNYGPGTVFLQSKGTFVIALYGDERVCGTAVGKVTESTWPLLQQLIEKVRLQGSTTRHKRSTGFGIWDISLK